MLKSLLIALFAIIFLVPFICISTVLFTFSGGGLVGVFGSVGTLATWAVGVAMVATA